MRPSEGVFREIIVDPVSLEAMPTADAEPFLNARSGGLTNKNDKEIMHFLKAFKPQDPRLSSYVRRIPVLPVPETAANTLILDIGCGPYDNISAIPGQHIFLDDIMDAFASRLSAHHDGLRICARTELMPIATGSVDVLYSVNMIDHVDDMPETIAEMHRVLRPGGRVYLQTYFNSHPLLETEPGVVDRSFLDTFVAPYFSFEYMRTFAMGDPAIPSSYTMDILACVLVPKPGAPPSRKPRNRYQDPDFCGPQSLISNAIRDLTHGGDGSAYIAGLEDEPCYALHLKLLQAWGMIVRGELGPANALLKSLLSLDQVRKNPFARIAILGLENKRIIASIKSPAR